MYIRLTVFGLPWLLTLGNNHNLVFYPASSMTPGCRCCKFFVVDGDFGPHPRLIVLRYGQQPQIVVRPVGPHAASHDEDVLVIKRGLELAIASLRPGATAHILELPRGFEEVEDPDVVCPLARPW